MKRTLFSFCIWLTSLAVALLSSGAVRAESSCDIAVHTPDDGDCVCPYSETESYGECHWYYNHCDPTAEVNEPEAVAASEEPAPCEPVEEPASDVEPLADEQADYWYDSESGSYYYYDFTDDAVVSEETAEDALNDLFDFADAEDVESDTSAQTEEVASDTADAYANEYGDHYYEEGDYYSEYEDYGWESDEQSYCPEDEVPAVDPAQNVTANESTEDVADDAAWQDSIVEDPWQEEYDYAYDDEEYEYRYGDEYDYDAEVTEDTQWDAADASVDDQVTDDAWEDEYYSDYEEYYSEYDDYNWADDEQTAETEEAVEPVAENGESVELWEDDHYDYDYDEYEYGYDYEYWEEQASDVQATEAENNVATVDDESANELHREAVLSLAHTLDRFGSALQNLSRKLTNMVTEEVAEGPAAETTQR